VSGGHTTAGVVFSGGENRPSMHRGWLLVGLAVTVALAGCGGAGDRTPEPIEATAAQATVASARRAAVVYQ